MSHNDFFPNLHLSQNKLKQDGPSLESSSYLNMTLRYLSPLDPGTMTWMLEPLDPGTLGLFVKRFQCYYTEKSFLVGEVSGDMQL